MKFSILAVASMLAGVVYSQSIQGDVAQLPSCSLTCLSNAVVSAGCSITDYACQCGSMRPAIASQATPCIVKACNITEALSKLSRTATAIPSPNNSQAPKSLAKRSVPSRPLQTRVREFYQPRQRLVLRQPQQSVIWAAQLAVQWMQRQLPL